MNKPVIYAIFFLMISCEENCSCGKIRKTIAVPVNVIENYESASANYCCILNSAMKKDKESLREISLMDFSDGFTYEHGNTLLELIFNPPMLRPGF